MGNILLNKQRFKASQDPTLASEPLQGVWGDAQLREKEGEVSPFPFHIHGAAGTWPFPTKYTSQIRGCKDHAQAPQQFTELHLAPWKQEAAEKSWWTMESGFPNEKNRMREKEREREKVSSSLWWKLAVLQPRSWGFSNSANGGKQA